VNLFPFLDALTGAIGVMIMFVVIMTLYQMFASEQEITDLPPIELSPDSKANFVPLFVECQRDKLVLHGKMKEFAPEAEIPAEQVAVEDKYTWPQVLRRITGKTAEVGGQYYILFLVRPYGQSIFKKARNILHDKTDLVVGWEPIPGPGKLKIVPRKRIYRGIGMPEE
jgi:hypothetical protein